MTMKFISFDLFERFIFSFWNKIRVYVDKKVQQQNSSNKAIEAVNLSLNTPEVSKELTDYIRTCLFDLQANLPVDQIVLTPSNMYVIWNDNRKSKLDISAIHCHINQGNVSTMIDVMLACQGQVGTSKVAAICSFNFTQAKQTKKWGEPENLFASTATLLN